MDRKIIIEGHTDSLGTSAKASPTGSSPRSGLAARLELEKNGILRTR